MEIIPTCFELFVNYNRRAQGTKLNPRHFTFSLGHFDLSRINSVGIIIFIVIWECQTNTKVGQTWADISKFSSQSILMIMFNAGNWSWYITKTIHWLMTNIVFTGRPGYWPLGICIDIMLARRYTLLSPMPLVFWLLVYRTFFTPECSLLVLHAELTLQAIYHAKTLDQYHKLEQQLTIAFILALPLPQQSNHNLPPL